MVLFRISDCHYINDLSGTGARLYGGRWNSKGNACVYLASSRALAMLEVLVHLQPLIVPNYFCLAEYQVPENNIRSVEISELPANWKDMTAPAELKKIGDDFLRQQKYFMLKLPSAVVADEFNYLLNPLHPDAKKVKTLKQGPFNFDERLVKRP